MQKKQKKAVPSFKTGKENVVIKTEDGKAGSLGDAKVQGGKQALQPPPEERDPIPWAQVELPLMPHTLMQCRWRDGTMRAARVIERRPLLGTTDQWEYYVHYRGVDRRMDCWRTVDDFDKDSIVPPRLLDEMDPKTKQPKYEEIESEDDGHHGFSVQKIRAHEAATKVKNIEQIELYRSR